MEAAAIISIALLDYADFAVRRPLGRPSFALVTYYLPRHGWHRGGLEPCVRAPMQLIVALLTVNACIGFYEDQNAGNAIAELAAQLAPKCKV